MRWLDPDALGAHIDRLYRAAWALCGSREDAEDLVQETFARVLARPRVLRGDDERAYLMRVLRNTFLTGRRDAARQPKVTDTLEDVQAPDLRARDRPEESLGASEVFTAIAALPEPFRLALVAVDIVGLSYREAATVLGTQEATITSRLYRARQQVVRALGQAQPPQAATNATTAAADAAAATPPGAAQATHAAAAQATHPAAAPQEGSARRRGEAQRVADPRAGGLGGGPAATALASPATVQDNGRIRHQRES